MTTEPKTFDCLKFKAEAQEAIRQATEGMTPEQEIAWFEARTQNGPFKALVQRVEEAQKKRTGKVAA